MNGNEFHNVVILFPIFRVNSFRYLSQPYVPEQDVIYSPL